jgi:hypothetical protein
MRKQAELMAALPAEAAFETDCRDVKAGKDGIVPPCQRCRPVSSLDPASTSGMPTSRCRQFQAGQSPRREAFVTELSEDGRGSLSALLQGESWREPHSSTWAAGEWWDGLAAA